MGNTFEVYVVLAGLAVLIVMVIVGCWLYLLGRRQAAQAAVALLALERTNAAQYEEIERLRGIENGLARRNDGYRRFIENIIEGYYFYRHDAAGWFDYLSPSVTRVLGYSVEEYRTQHDAMFTDNPLNNEARHKTELVLDGKRQPTYEVEVRAKDGSIHRLEVTEYPVLNTAGRVEAVEGIAYDVTDRVKLEDRLVELAVRDEMSGLYNRRHLLERLDEAVSLAQRHHQPLAFAMLDLDGLKKINDNYGHMLGDRMIRSAAQILQLELRCEDVPTKFDGITGRLGGDEFAVIFPDTMAAQARVAMERVLASFANCPIRLTATQITHLSASVGIVELADGMDVEELQQRADQALYQAKNAGRGRVCLWEPTPAK